MLKKTKVLLLLNSNKKQSYKNQLIIDNEDYLDLFTSLPTNTDKESTNEVNNICNEFKDKFTKNYELYFLSLEEKPQIGDWYVVELFDVERNGTLHLEQVKSIDDIWINNSDIISTRHINNCKKVIATTNDLISINLGLEKWVAPTNKNDDLIYTRLSPFPKPSQSFINKFIEKWNSKAPIEFVNVDYDCDHSQMPNKIIDVLKVDRNNEITITPIKDSWSREEVINHLKMLDKHVKQYNHYFFLGIDNWIEQNL